MTSPDDPSRDQTFFEKLGMTFWGCPGTFTTQEPKNKAREARKLWAGPGILRESSRGAQDVSSVPVQTLVVRIRNSRCTVMQESRRIADSAAA